MRRDTLFAILLALVTFFAFNDALPTDIMEARNIVTARDIAGSNDPDVSTWLVPTMNGELRLEKPPLPTWVAAAIEKACPGSLGAQRAAAGVMGMLWTLFLYLFAKLVSQRRGYAMLAVMVFLTSYHIVVMGRTATWDIYCHAFMMGGIYFLTRGLIAAKREQWRWMPAAGLMMGLSFMSKGPVSFYALLLPALIAVIAFLHPTVNGKWASITVMVAICLIVGGWWYAYLLVFQHDAVDAVIHKESGAWAGHNVRPWFYYWRFFAETGVWAVMMLAALAVPYWKRVLREGRRTYLFAMTWTIAALVLLSLMPEKKIRYLLPMMAPCALCVACLIEHLDMAEDTPSRVLLRINGYLVCAIAVSLPIMTVIFHWASPVVAAGAGALSVAVAVYVAVSTHRMQAVRMTYGVCALFMTVECLLLKPIGNMFGNPGARSISITKGMAGLRDVPFCHPQDDDIRIEIIYEAGRKILPLDTGDTSAVRRKMPFVLVSHRYAAQVLPGSILHEADTMSLGTFDDNKHPRTDRHYTKDFIYHATLVKAAEKEGQRK